MGKKSFSFESRNGEKCFFELVSLLCLVVRLYLEHSDTKTKTLLNYWPKCTGISDFHLVVTFTKK